MQKISNPLILATHNEGKVAEFQSILAPYNIELTTSKNLKIEEPEETEETFEGNAILKAKFVYNLIKQNTLADDSGLEVSVLNSAPGVYSARWAGENRDFDLACNKVLTLMKHSTNRDAQFVCVLALQLNNGEIKTFHGNLTGTISQQLIGKQGFGYDKIFIPTGYSTTLAELSLEAKNKISHRKQAIDKLINWLNYKE